MFEVRLDLLKTAESSVFLYENWKKIHLDIYTFITITIHYVSTIGLT